MGCEDEHRRDSKLSEGGYMTSEGTQGVAGVLDTAELIDDYGVCGCCIHGGECNSLEKQDCDANIKAWLKKEKKNV